MAIQSQYPSNVLLLNINAAVETKHEDRLLELQSQPSSRFVDGLLQFDYTVGRKRRREVDMNPLMSILHQQQYHNQSVDETQLQSRNIDVSTGLRLAFKDKQQLQNRSLSSQSSILSILSEDLSIKVSQQRNEIDQFIHARGEALRHTLVNKRQIHYHALLLAAEGLISRQIKDKEAEAKMALRRNAELEARALHLSTEAQAWQAKARAQEMEVVALQTRLHDAIMSEEVWRKCAGRDTEDAESAYIDPDRAVLVSGPGCKACGKRVASVVLLPCRHLCVCTECDNVVSACPLCLNFRSSSIEVYMS